MKLKEAMDKYGDYEVKEDELKKILEKPKPKTVWDLKKGDVYWYINTNGDVIESDWIEGISDTEAREMGNIFLTEQDAEFERERRKIEAIMLKYGRRMFSHDCSNYMIRMSEKHAEIMIPNCLYYSYGVIYFDTTELARKAVEEIGTEKFRKYYFRAEKQKNNTN
ncbi:hypothetical protein [[Eubacterium] hominis]|uniref:hypothetical protein n=1 Tax=[Eubacterium] hominis TaxID=2764325 RepID=UPI0022E8C0C5